MARAKLAVIHVSSLEHYPPVLNFLSSLQDERWAKSSVSVYSMTNKQVKESKAEFDLKVYRRYIPIVKGLNTLFLLLYYLEIFVYLLVTRPKSIMYFESISAFPVYLYTLFRKDFKLYIHYHEYNTIQQYEKTMLANRLSWKFEKKALWKKAELITHTNPFRVRFFEKNYPWIDKNKLSVLPNFPPAYWSSFQKVKKDSEVIRLVYVGSLGLKNFYWKEIVKWVEHQEGKFVLDCYYRSLSSDEKHWFKELAPKHTILKRSNIPYKDIPQVINQYHVGLILYKGHSLNYVYNETNKLFEYLACGLSVWYPENLEGVNWRVKKDNLSNVHALNFNHIVAKDSMFTWNGINPSYACEDIYKPYLQKMVIEN